MLCDQALLGCLFVVGGCGRVFLPNDIQVARTTAVYLGIVIGQQRQIEELKRRLHQVRRLTDFSEVPPSVNTATG